MTVALAVAFVVLLVAVCFEYLRPEPPLVPDNPPPVTQPGPDGKPVVVPPPEPPTPPGAKPAEKPQPA